MLEGKEEEEEEEEAGKIGFRGIFVLIFQNFFFRFSFFLFTVIVLLSTSTFLCRCLLFILSSFMLRQGSLTIFIAIVFLILQVLTIPCM